jgi:hypothetical protein
MKTARFLSAARLEFLAEVIYYNTAQPGSVADSPPPSKTPPHVLLRFLDQAAPLSARHVVCW